jgi:fructokinase
VRIGIDLGGTKIEGIALDAHGREMRRLRIAAPRGEYRDTLAAIASIVQALERETGASGSVGIGIPGAPSPDTGLIKNANSTWLIGRALGPDLEQALGRPVRLANDANCFALSEAIDGAAAGAGVVFGVILGTGCGGGIVVHGCVLTGPNAIAGEWGHNPLPAPDGTEWPGPACYCGRSGCIETFLSGPALARDYISNGGAPMDAEEIARRATGGDALASAALDRYEGRLARALTTVVNLLDPDVIVLGGGVSNIPRLYTNVPPLLRPFGGEPPRTRVVRARFGDSSGVRGAAWLWGGP